MDEADFDVSWGKYDHHDFIDEEEIERQEIAREIEQALEQADTEQYEEELEDFQLEENDEDLHENTVELTEEQIEYIDDLLNPAKAAKHKEKHKQNETSDKPLVITIVLPPPEHTEVERKMKHPPPPTTTTTTTHLPPPPPPPPPSTTTQLPPPLTTTQLPPPPPTTQLPSPSTTTQLPPPLTTTQLPPPLTTTQLSPPPITTQLPPPPPTTKNTLQTLYHSQATASHQGYYTHPQNRQTLPITDTSTPTTTSDDLWPPVVQTPPQGSSRTEASGLGIAQQDLSGIGRIGMFSSDSTSQQQWNSSVTCLLVFIFIIFYMKQ